MKRRLWGILFLFFSAMMFAQTDFPSLEPLFFYEPAEDVLSGEDVIRAGLEFSLCPAEAGAAVIERYLELEKEIVSTVAELDEMEKGEKILSLMYERVLTQYSVNQTRVDEMFLKGTYNCVSSSVLYFALARAVGLQVAGQETPEHAFCSLYIGGKKIDVETTNPGGFNPGVKKIVEQTERSTRYFMVPKKYYSGRKEISERKFVSLVGRNMVSMMNDRNDYATGVPLSAARIVFVGNAFAKDAAAVREDFDTLCGNYAVELDQKRKESEKALDWLDAVYARWGSSAELQKKYNTIAYNCAVNYVNAGDYENARRAFTAHKDNLTQKNASAIDVMIFSAWVEDEVKKLEPEDAVSFLHEQYKLPVAKEKSVASRLVVLEEYAWYQILKPFFDSGKYLLAADIADEGLYYVPSSKNLQKIKTQCLQNYAVDVHNKFADLANAGRYEEAMQVVQKGLINVPTNSLLKNDLKKLENFLKR
ncbi:MAG: hypothetical protein IJS09_08050 [Treponema sp.]|nr:hypothetical protein [Treponema sp.]